MAEDYGKKIYHLLVGIVVVVGIVGGYWFVTRNGHEQTTTPEQVEQDAAQVCSDALDKLIEDERQGDAVDGAVYDEFGDRCPAEYRIWADYQSIKGTHAVSWSTRCDDYESYDVDPAAIRLARRDGLCAP